MASFKRFFYMGIVVYNFNLSPQDTEADESELEANLVYKLCIDH